jgi:hypothetical protein
MEDKRPTADLVVDGPGGGIQLVVEAKNTVAPSPEWAARFLRNLFIHAQIPPTPFFLLALRDHLYLWRQPSGDPGPPEFEGDTATALQPYLRRIHGSLDSLNQRSFEALIYTWISDIIAGMPETEQLAWLRDSGLAESIRDGIIRSKAA